MDMGKTMKNVMLGTILLVYIYVSGPYGLGQPIEAHV
jgi:hypothetical protein